MTLDAARYTDPFLHTYRTVPAAGPGVCAVCHGGPSPGREVCHSCAFTMAQVSYPTLNVVPVSLYEMPSRFWQMLRAYKDGSQPGRAVFTLQIAAILARYTARHLRCVGGLLGGVPDIVSVVPSTRPGWRPGRHPLEVAVGTVVSLARLHAPVLAPGPAAAGHGFADDDAFALTRRLRGERVLLIDDTFTTGARIQSAASALRAGGASSVAALAVGRVIWPEWNENCRRIWDRACAQRFSFDDCCLCRR